MSSNGDGSSHRQQFSLTPFNPCGAHVMVATENRQIALHSACLPFLTVLRRLYLHSYNAGKVVSIGLPDGKTVNCIEPVLGSDCVALGCRFDGSLALLQCTCDPSCSDGIMRLLSLADLKVSVPSWQL
jgi:hypothetical protein